MDPEPWESVDVDHVPADVRDLVAILMAQANEAGCCCDPEVRIPQLGPGDVGYAEMIHEAHCPLGSPTRPQKDRVPSFPVPALPGPEKALSGPEKALSGPVGKPEHLAPPLYAEDTEPEYADQAHECRMAAIADARKHGCTCHPHISVAVVEDDNGDLHGLARVWGHEARCLLMALTN